MQLIHHLNPFPNAEQAIQKRKVRESEAHHNIRIKAQCIIWTNNQSLYTTIQKKIHDYLRIVSILLFDPRDETLAA